MRFIIVATSVAELRRYHRMHYLIAYKINVTLYYFDYIKKDYVNPVGIRGLGATRAARENFGKGISLFVDSSETWIKAPAHDAEPGSLTQPRRAMPGSGGSTSRAKPNIVQL